MTRKDFELIAGVLAGARKYATAEEQNIIDYITETLSDKILMSHPRFDDYRFRLASGNIQEEVINGVTHIRTGNNRIFA